ncbi:hypothetical protein [Streptomyces melanogenes]|uniref:Uncharacterized protein n=1 Tax=Streptomyces melanogenes TaxID=67326 RepID=A0ABZ1XBK9_9ACTN|nr:hypothetical protein [Streptomyces melanogenes]
MSHFAGPGNGHRAEPGQDTVSHPRALPVHPLLRRTAELPERL